MAKITHEQANTIEMIGYKHVEAKLVTIRGQHIIIDSDVADMYGVETKEINQAVKNNPEKFPIGYIFEVDSTEKNELVKNFDRFQSLKHSSVLPKAFTEKGLYMLATILKSPKATAGLFLGALDKQYKCMYYVFRWRYYMPLLQVRDFPADIYAEVAFDARAQHRTIAQQIIVLIQKGLGEVESNRERRRQVLEEIAAMPPVSDEVRAMNVVQLIREGRERK